MTIAVGHNIYEITVDKGNVSGSGFLYSDDELNSALQGPVAEVLFDDVGKTELEKLLTGSADTDFNIDFLKEILEVTSPPENWRIGEALAEVYLTHHNECFFPWPDGRDERKSGSSLPGADLVGLKKVGDDYCFAFGEVKTSSDTNYPPALMYGREGLKQQLEDLKDSIKIKNDLVVYLMHRAVNAVWKDQFINAYTRFEQSITNVHIFGFLVRDVKPNEKDLGTRVVKLAENAYTDMVIQLFAMYLPENSISTLSEKVVSSRSGDNE